MLTKLLVPLLLLTLLLGAAAARADSTTSAAAPAAVEEAAEFEFEEEGEEESPEEECEEATEEFEEGEIDQEELDEACERQRKRAAHGNSREECVLRSAHAHAAVDAAGDILKLTIGYTAYEPAPATIDLSKGPTIHRQLNRSGVIRTVEHLRESQNTRRLVVEIRIPSAERAGCPSRRLVLFPR